MHSGFAVKVGFAVEVGFAVAQSKQTLVMVVLNNLQVYDCMSKVNSRNGTPLLACWRRCAAVACVLKCSLRHHVN